MFTFAEKLKQMSNIEHKDVGVSSLKGTPSKKIYIKTSTEAVYNPEGVTQEYINNHVDGSKIVNGTITTGKIANGAVSMGKLDNEVQTLIQQGADSSWTPKGDFNIETTYDANDVVFDPETNSSYLSLRADNMGHAVTDETWWMKVLDGSYVNLLEEELQQLVDSISEGTQQQVEELNEALEALEAQADQSRQDIQDIVDSLAVVQTTGQSASDVMSQKAVTDSLVSSVIAYDNSQSGLGAENVQRAINTVYAKIEDNTEFRELGGFITANGFAVSSNGEWTQVSSSNYTHKHIAVTSDMKVVKVTANSNKSAIIFFVTEYDTPVNTEKVKFCEGILPIIIRAGQTKELLIPSDCGSIIVDCQGGLNDYTPSSIKIGYKDVSKTANDSYKAVKEHYDMLTVFKPLTTGWTSGTGLPSGKDGEWTQVGNSNYTHEYIAREEDMKILRVTAKSSKPAYVFFVKEYVTPVNGKSVVFCGGTATNSIQAGKSDVFIIPDDCEYIIIMMNANTNNYTPDSIEINDGDKLSTSVDVDFDDYNELYGWIGSDGNYHNNEGSGHYVIDVSGYDKVTGLASADDNSYFVLASAVNGNSWTKIGERITKASNTNFEIKTNGAPYLIVGSYVSQYYRDNNESTLPQSLQLISSDRIGVLEDKVSKLEDGGIGKTDIVSLNGRVELTAMFNAAVRAERTDSSQGITIHTSPVVFLHFSDLHGNESNLIRIVSLYNAYSDYVDDVINTGDTILNRFEDDFTFYASRGAGSFLNVIGNHDAQKRSNSYATETELYTKFIGPFISQWGVTSYTENKCYYYKDYTGRNLRLIVLDAYNINWNSNNAQITWLESVLADAITRQLHVMIAVHSGLCRKSDLDCNFNSMQARWNWLGSNDNVVTWQGQVDGYLGSVVDTFIQNGGKFICWLSGHTHCDVMGFGARHPNQMTINIGSSGNMELVNRVSDIERVEDTKSQDCVNMVVVDTFKKQLKLYRIGGDIDRYFRSRKALVYDYDNKEVIYQR